MFRRIAWLFIGVGIIILGWNLFHWWSESNTTKHDPELTQTILKDWENIKPKNSITTGIATTKSSQTGEQMGQLIIPRLDSAVLPIVHGTDDNSLKKGVGHYVGYGTVNPGETGHVVLSGHRDTVFRGVGKLKVGDQLIVDYDNHYFIYQIRKTWITHADDRTVIVPKSKPILTLTTCYPFDYVGNAPDRYIMESELIQIKNK